MREAFLRDAGANYNDIVYYSQLADWKLRITTPNASTQYVYLQINLSDGPIVIDVPAAVGAALFGSILDAWQVPLVDVGPQGEDQGQGGRYVLIPPGFEDDLPPGVIAVRFSTINGYAALRASPEDQSPAAVERALDLVRRLRMYPLARLGRPPEQRFIDMAGKLLDGIVRFDASFFDRLARMIDEEPALPRDAAMIEELRTFGIEKGKPFAPDAALRSLLDNAARTAHASFVQQAAEDGAPYWPNRRWRTVNPTGAQTGFTFENADGTIDIKARGLIYFLACAPPARLGKATFYVIGYTDRDGNTLSGDHTYRLHIPAHVPAKLFWAATVYDRETATFIRDAPRVEVGSNTRGLETNPDGSVDLFVGPEAPAGREANWAYAAPGKSWFVMFRFYGPTEELFAKTWQLQDFERVVESKSHGESVDEATKLAVDAYIYGYPLVTSELTRRVMTNVAKVEGLRAPMGQFAHAREYPDADFRDVTTPNADTLYSFAWIDVSEEPYVLSIPDAGDRYFLYQMLDAWTNVFQSPGTRTTGTRAQRYAITGPRWNGTLPAGVQELKSPTGLVLIIGRTYCTGTRQDYDEVHRIQDQVELVPLGQYGRPYEPPPGRVDPDLDMKTAVRDQVHALSGESFFRLMSELMKKNPATTADAPMLSTLAKLGLAPEQPFDATSLDAAVRQALERAPMTAQRTLVAGIEQVGKLINGWLVTVDTGAYGTNYLQRAVVALVGFGANLPEDAVYPLSKADAHGQPYSGENAYILHFEKDQLPPVKGFWSLTMYDDQMFFVDNELDKYTVSPRDNLRFNADGSLDIYLQHDSPGADRKANWLPAPSGRFNVMLRLYWPEPSVISGEWEPPPIERQQP
ncbi:MAG: DUF1254 domain-containing protein [Kofleriaceae bacterium]|nr:DUF1254 domain-containing protein [Kofleriaceae bacterium]